MYVQIVRSEKEWRDYLYSLDRLDEFREHKGEPKAFPCFAISAFTGEQHFNATSRIYYEHEFIYEKDFEKLKG